MSRLVVCWELLLLDDSGSARGGLCCWCCWCSGAGSVVVGMGDCVLVDELEVGVEAEEEDILNVCNNEVGRALLVFV